MEYVSGTLRLTAGPTQLLPLELVEIGFMARWRWASTFTARA